MSSVLAFAHIQKTAGTTVGRALRRSLGWRHRDVAPMHPTGHYYDWVFTAADHRATLRRGLLPRSIAGHQVKPFTDLGEAFPEIRFFTFLREPIKRTASHFQYSVGKGFQGSFDEWIELPHYRNLQCRHIGGSEEAERAMEMIERRRVLAFTTEDLTHGFATISRVVGQEIAAPGRRHNVAKDNSLSQQVLETRMDRLEEATVGDRALYSWVRTNVPAIEEADVPVKSTRPRLQLLLFQLHQRLLIKVPTVFG